MTLASGLDAGASAGAHSLARYRSEFPIFRDAVYLNTCSLGALGERTRRRITEFIDLWQARGARSEEHTSELQSRLHLVCRLLLGKKKNTVLIECLYAHFVPSA